MVVHVIVRTKGGYIVVTRKATLDYLVVALVVVVVWWW